MCDLSPTSNLIIIDPIHLQLDNVRMTKQLHILDFTANFADDIKAFDLLSIENFDRYFVPCKAVSSN